MSSLRALTLCSVWSTTYRKRQDPQLKPEQLNSYNAKDVFVAPTCYELLMSDINHKRGKHERKESSSTALVVSALVPFVMDQVTSLRERGVTECILSGHARVSKELLVTASDVSKRLVLWRFLLEYINLIILRRFYGKLCACANSVYQAVFFVLGTRLKQSIYTRVRITSKIWKTPRSKVDRAEIT